MLWGWWLLARRHRHRHRMRHNNEEEGVWEEGYQRTSRGSSLRNVRGGSRWEGWAEKQRDIGVGEESQLGNHIKYMSGVCP